MNLIQIQDRLKDLPTQVIMSYADGANPQVPPYLALGELNRRKQMEQKTAQAPQGTVKENIEQQVGLLSLQRLRQGQMAQQSAMQGAQAPTIPEGSPEPVEQPQEEMAMAAGGLTRLPVQNMNFGSGGIVAFAEGDLVIEDAARDLQAAQQRLQSFENKTYKNLAERQQDVAAIEAAKADVARAEDRMASASSAGMDTRPVGVMGRPFSKPVRNAQQQAEARVQPTFSPDNQSAAETARLLRQSAGIGSIAPPPAPRPQISQAPQAAQASQTPQAPAAPAPVSAAMQLLNDEMRASTKPVSLPEFAPPKQTPIGEDYLKYMSEREGKNKQDDERFKERETARSKRDFFQSLIDAGEATRGQKGIGALFGGYGRSSGKFANEADERQVAYEKIQQDRMDNNAKLKFEIANLRRAEERGDAKSVYDSKVKIFEYQQKDRELAVQAAGQTVRIESAERISDKEIGSRERTAELDRKARASVASMKSNEQQMAEKVISSYLAKNPTKSYHEGFEAYKSFSTGSGDRNDLNALKILSKEYGDYISDPIVPKAEKEKYKALYKQVNDKIAEKVGITGLPDTSKTISMADVKTTAKSSGKTEQQVIEAAKARGYIIQ